MKNATKYALAMLLLSGWSASAQGPKSPAAHKLDLGPIAGTAYYTTGPDGFRVVATLSPIHITKPMRFGATLMPGQSVTVSIAGDHEAAPASLQIARVGDEVQVRHSQVTVLTID